MNNCTPCAAKHISKSKCTKHISFGALLGIEMMKKCTPLWRKAHFEVKEVKKLTVSDHFWKLSEMMKNCTPLWRKAHFQVKKYTILRPLLEVETFIYLYLFYLSLSLSPSLSLSLSIYLSICKFENEAILRNFLNF